MRTTTPPRLAAALLFTLACGEATAPPARIAIDSALAVSSCDQCASSILAWTSTRDGNEEIYTAAPDGTGPVNLTIHAATDRNPAVSPDGRSIAFSSNRGGTYDIWVMDIDGANPRRLTSGPDVEVTPTWSPDGTRLAFVSASSAVSFTLRILTVDGSANEPLVTTPGLNAAPDWSPDGHRIAFHSDRTGNIDVWVIDLPTGTETRLTTDPATDGYPAWSPDGQTIAFASTRRANEWDIYTMNSSGGNAQAHTSDAAVEASPDWSPDGTHLVYERFPSPVAQDGEVFTLRLGGSSAVNVSNNAAVDRGPSWGVLAIPAQDVEVPGIKVLLVYEDRQWQTGARPSATGADYWIEARLVNEQDPRRGPIVLGRIQDEAAAYQLSDARYRLHLTYGPGSSSGSGLNVGADLVTPLSVRARDGRTVVDSVSLTDVLGVIEGIVTVNGAAPGSGFSACVLMGRTEYSEPRFDWCLPLADDGTYRLLLPDQPGTLAICRTTEVEAGTCSRADIEAGRALARVPTGVRSGQTQIMDPIDIQTSALVVALSYRDDSWSAPDVPSATGAAYWIEGLLEPSSNRDPLRPLGMIHDRTSAYGMPAGSYDVRLVYGAVPARAMRLSVKSNLVPSVRVSLDGRSTETVTVDISAAVGVIELPVTVNGGSPGAGYSACVLLPGSSASDDFRWCQPIPDDGVFRLLLPRDGTGEICLTREASGTACTAAGLNARGPLANFSFRVRPGRRTVLVPINLELRSAMVRLEYKDRDWSAPAAPSATGAEYWIQGRLEPRSRFSKSETTVDLGRIADAASALGLVGTDYDLHLSYGPQVTSSSRYSLAPPDLVTPVGVNLGRTGQTVVTVNVSNVVGSIEGAFTFNGARPGAGYAFCISMGQTSRSGAFDWCPTIPADGSIRFLLPEGRGTAAICRAADIVSSTCPTTTLKQPVATVTFDVRAGRTRNISSDLTVP